ncbi:MAG: HepT-like ribonuclease domain-containing protein [Pyrobaculum sp.]
MRIRRIIEDAERRTARIPEVTDEDALRQNLYAVLQDVLDALAVLYSAMGWKKPGSYVSSVKDAVARGVLKTDISHLARLRNRLAHAYREIDYYELLN